MAATLPQPQSRTRRLRNFHAGNNLFRSGDPAASLFAIRQGTVKLAQLIESGEECVTSLCIPGEVLGLEAFGIGRYVYDATALEPVQVCELPLPALDDCSTHTLEPAAS